VLSRVSSAHPKTLEVRLGGELVISIGALASLRGSDHTCPSLLQGLERGCCGSICWGLMRGDGFGLRLSRMSDDFWCPAGNAVRATAFAET